MLGTIKQSNSAVTAKKQKQKQKQKREFVVCADMVCADMVFA